MFRLAGVQDWWEISRRYPVLRGRDQRGALKTLGYAHLIDQILANKPKRILEFGYGMGSPLLGLFEAEAEVWAIDDYVPVPYWTREIFEAGRSAFQKRFTKVRFENGLMGAGRNQLPSDYFDFVGSVSVLEELTEHDIAAIVADATRVLRPGGIFVNSMDLTTNFTKNVEHFFACHGRLGLEWLSPGTTGRLDWNIHDVAFEDPCYVMEAFMSYQPDEGRKWPGNFCTVLSAARKLDPAAPRARTAGTLGK